MHVGDDEVVLETEVQKIADDEQIGQLQVDVPQRSLGNLVQDYRQVVLGEDSEASTTIVAEKENNQQATTTTNKSITAISIADADTDD